MNIDIMPLSLTNPLAMRIGASANLAVATHVQNGVSTARRLTPRLQGLSSSTAVISPRRPGHLRRYRLKYSKPEKCMRLNLLASGGTTADTPTDGFTKFPFRSKARCPILPRVNIAVKCVTIAVVLITALTSNFFTASEGLWSTWVVSAKNLLTNAPAAAWKSYTQAAATHPWSTCMIISGTPLQSRNPTLIDALTLPWTSSVELIEACGTLWRWYWRLQQSYRISR